MFDNYEINNNVQISELYDGKTWIHGKNKDNIYITIFLITISSNQLIYSLESINNIDIDTGSVLVNCIKDICPTFKAYNEMRLRCKTKYFIQNDEDMEMFPNCLDIINNAIKKSNDKIIFNSFKLIDNKLGIGTPPIIDCLKVYNQNIMINYPTRSNSNLQTSSVDTMWHAPILADGYTINHTNIIIGYHGKHRSDFDILLRYCKIIKSLITPTIKTNSSHMCKILKPLFSENNPNEHIKKILYLISNIKTIDYTILDQIIGKLNSYVNNNALTSYNIINRITITNIKQDDLISCDKTILNNINNDCLMAIIAIGSVCTNSYEYSFDKYPYDIYDYIKN